MAKNNLPVGVRQQANGTFSCRINVKDENGEWKNKERSGFRTVKEAQTARTLLQAEYIKDPTLINKKESNITISELYDEFISKQATGNCVKSTIKRYDSLQKNHIGHKWGNRKIKNIKPYEITDYLLELTQTLSYAYIMSIHKYIRVLFKYAISREYMTENPIDKVTAPKQEVEGVEVEGVDGVDGMKIKTYTQSELDVFEERFATTNLLSAFKLGRALGIRCAETFGLLWSDVDWDKHTISINKQLVYEDRMWCLRRLKTKSSIREIELQDSIYSYLKELKDTQEQQKAELGVAYRDTRVAIDLGKKKTKKIVDNLAFINVKPNGELLTPDSEKVLPRIARDELGCNFKFHNLRHTHASWLAEKGLPIVVIKTRLGHSKIETTQKYYQHVTDGMRKNLIDTLNSI
jgi:integrase